MKLFLIPYSRLIDLVSIPALRLEELNADSCAMDFVDEKIMLDTLKSESIARAFLKLHYWTSVRSMVIKDPKTTIRPFTKLGMVFKNLSTLESRKKWLSYAFEEEQLPGDSMPVLRERMEGIGHIKIRSIPVPTENAAEKYLGENRGKIFSVLDKLWLSTTLKPWLKEYKEKRTNLEKIRNLSRRSRQRVLWPGDIVRYAFLARKINGSPLGMSVRKLLKRNVQHLLPPFLVNKISPQAEAGDLFR